MHVCTLVGARPQFVKAAAVSPALEEAGIKETLIHSGQHYDELLSQVFFEELGVPPPILNLEVGSGSHAAQTGEIMVRLEQFINETGPYDAAIVYGGYKYNPCRSFGCGEREYPPCTCGSRCKEFQLVNARRDQSDSHRPCIRMAVCAN